VVAEVFNQAGINGLGITVQGVKLVALVPFNIPVRFQEKLPCHGC
jgi:hypothetical protein